ncbi:MULTISPECIES: helix-turn-helix domain-containing protein [Okeania]|uniref:helix-turn-helix domain-containing protein n=1 Tax=Okeania TaxID=1458928 RepID=UPI00257A8A0C|nr:MULTISPECIES: transcriptional regulator [unclassified Okeania]
MAVLEELTFAKNLTQEEKALYDLLVLLIENYEAENYPMASVKPYEVLQHLITASGISQQNLVGIIGSDEVVSQVVDGQLSLNNWQAKVLADYFQISPTIFQL